MKNCIEVKNLNKSYGNRVVVKNLNLTVKKGEVFGLLGPNGAGKSTTIDCILGLKLFENGSVQVLGMDPTKERKQLFERVGVQLQSSSYQGNIRVGEVCEEIAALYQSPADYHDLLAQFKLDHYLKQPVAKLSGGEKQKLSILLALIPQPEVLFLDELTTGLDTEARREVWQVLTALKEKELTLFLTSHYMDEVEVLCDRVCIINRGEALVTDTVPELIRKSPYKRLEEAYLWFMKEEIAI
ncbi:ABC transporter ATP-binding protein [Acetobacterium wieringae]|uniref:ABC transporter ATP-binding protein n=1 Tax=Acetobacterium wieringae TaxID=52694 RepID=A0ABY6HKC2_9FIRM|nr:ABC transporter ATP-binding protein [Acetobacterium wieringae]UYO64036.1 ABC transporter ATP-binding protein [Acetobacterium wieringae]VUZ25525.1 putative multidrug ABC transporter ATP-binding protein YbhF [Acetobacterium wieringae]